MKKLFFKLFCIAASAGIQQASAQVTGLPFEKIYRHSNIPSVDAFNFVKSVDQGINPSTGALNVSIPLYVYEDNDFKLPISIDYTCTGYIPNIPAGNVGHGWVLNAGGVISREVRGIADEYRAPKTGTAGPYAEYGEQGKNGYFLYYLNALKQPDQNYIFPFNKCKETAPESFPFVILNIYEDNSGQYETNPDIFTFRFPGYSGKFNINQNKIDVYDTSSPFGEFDVDLTNFSPVNATDKSIIRITTGDGYIYTFGGLDTIDDTRVKNEQQNFGAAENRESPNMHPGFRNNRWTKYTNWQLTGIEAPNGRKIQFNYSAPEMVQSVMPSGFLAKSTGSADFTKFNSANFVRVCYTAGERRLLSIDIDGDCLIEFDYTDAHSTESAYAVDEKSATGILKGTSATENITVSKKISSIQVSECYSTTKKTIKNITLQYIKLGTAYESNSKAFLASIDKGSEGTYKFRYYSENKFELSNGTAAMDYWGYYTQNIYGAFTDYNIWGWNFQVDITDKDIMSNISCQGVSDYYLGSLTLKNPKYNKMVMGMLGRITHPSGGYTYVEYENNDASKYVRREVSSTSSGLPEIASYSLFDNSKKTIYDVGGLRVKKISHSTKKIPTYDSQFSNLNPGNEGPGPSYCITKEYEYKNTNGTSSGVVLRAPIYQMKEEKKIKTTVGYKSIIYSIYSMNDVCSNFSNEYHIQYRRVVEKLNDGSSTEYIYSTYLDTPDKDPLAEDPSKYKTSSVQWLRKKDEMDAFKREMISHASDRGKLLSKRHYNAQGDSLTAEYYVYDRSKNLRYTEEALHTGALRYAHRILTESYPLVKMISNQYFRQDGTIRTQSRSEAYKYNNLGQLIETRTMTGNLDSLLTNTYYVTDLYTQAGANSIYDKMLEKNMINKPLVVLSHEKSARPADRPWKLNNAEKNIYSTSGINSIPMLASQWKSDISTPYIFGSLDAIDYRKVSGYKYDDLGNMVEMTDKDGVPTAYIWSYKSTYPVVEVKNMTQDSLLKLLPTNEMPGLADASNLSREDANRLHAIYSAVPKTNVTVYTYKPLVGISYKIDPAGRTTTYEYDDAGRLKQVIGDRGEIIENYEYNFKSEF